MFREGIAQHQQAGKAGIVGFTDHRRPSRVLPGCAGDARQVRYRGAASRSSDRSLSFSGLRTPSMPLRSLTPGGMPLQPEVLLEGHGHRRAGALERPHQLPVGQERPGAVPVGVRPEIQLGPALPRGERPSRVDEDDLGVTGQHPRELVEPGLPGERADRVRQVLRVDRVLAGRDDEREEHPPFAQARRESRQIPLDDPESLAPIVARPQ